MIDIHIGMVASCMRGRLGVITRIIDTYTPKLGVEKTQSDVSYIGVGFDGRPWYSKKPTYQAENIFDWLNNQSQDD